MSKIVEMHRNIQEIFHTDPQKERDVYTEISRFVSVAFTQAMASDEGYCFKFTLPITGVLKLYKTIGVEQKDVFAAYKSDWGAAAMTNHMHSNPYYQILLLLIYYGLEEKKEYIYNNALMCVLMKVWNGRKARLIKYCDKRVMKYVTTHMVTGKHSVSKFDSPVSLLHDHYVHTIIKKYGPEVKRDPKKLQRLFEQCYARLIQIFAFNYRLNIKTGKKEAQGGILPLYLKAKEMGMAITSPSTPMGDDDETYDTQSSIHVRDEIINDVADHITFNPNPTYPTHLINTLWKRYGVKLKTIEVILTNMHSNEYYDILHDLISVILSRTNVFDKSDICKPDYLAVVKKTIISSKNNPDTVKIQKLCDMILKSIYSNPKLNLAKAFDAYSNVTRIAIRNVLIQGIVYNIRKVVCKGQAHL